MSKIQTGDIAFFQPTGITGWLICKVTKSPYCHCGILEVDETNGEIWITEYREFGCRMTLLSVAEHEWKAKAHIYRYTHLGQWTAEVIAERMTQYPKDYGYFHFLWIAFYMLFFRKVTKRFIPKECKKHAPTCSEAVCRAFREIAGIDLVPGIPDLITSPGDIIRSKKIIKVDY